MTDTNDALEVAKPLPAYLVQRYRGWLNTGHEENKAWYKRLAEEGQRPRCMVISCCDSRVHGTQLFGAEPGELFMHRNVANLVPPSEPDGNHHGTSAAIEYAVTALHIANLIVIGHSQCGGVKGCYEMCSGNAPELERKESFVGRWIDILRPGYERIKGMDAGEDALRALELEGVRVSLENLMTFDFVQQAVATGQLSLHGVWIDIASGEMQMYDGEKKAFVPVGSGR